MIKTALPTPPHQASPHAAVPGDGAPHIAPNRLVDRPNSVFQNIFIYLFYLSILVHHPLCSPWGGWCSPSTLLHYISYHRNPNERDHIVGQLNWCIPTAPYKPSSLGCTIQEVLQSSQKSSSTAKVNTNTNIYIYIWRIILKMATF